jgi:hypothetical protein
MATINTLDQLPKTLTNDVFWVVSSHVKPTDLQEYLKKQHLANKISFFTVTEKLGPAQQNKLIEKIKWKMSNPFHFKSCVFLEIQTNQKIPLENFDLQRPLFVFSETVPAISGSGKPSSPASTKNLTFSAVLKQKWKPTLAWLVCASALLLGTYGITWKLSLNQKDTIYNQMRVESVNSPYSTTYIQYSSPSLQDAATKKAFVSSSSVYYNTISKNGNALVNTVLTADVRQWSTSPVSLALEGSDLTLSPSVITTSTVGYISGSTNPEYRLYNYFDAVSIKRMFHVTSDWIGNNNNVCFISTSIADKLLAKLNEGQTTVKTYSDLLYQYDTRSSNDIRLNINGDSYIISNILEKGAFPSDYYDFFKSVLGEDFICLSTSTTFYAKNSNLLTIAATLPISYYTLKDYLDKNILSRWSSGDQIHYFSTEKKVENDVTSYTWVQKQELNDLGSDYDRLSSKGDPIDSYCYLGFFLACFLYFGMTYLLMKTTFLHLTQVHKNTFDKIIYISLLTLIPLGVSNGLMQISRLSNTDFANRLLFSGTGSALGLLMWALPLLFLGSYFAFFKRVDPNKLAREPIQGVKFNEYKI